MAGQAEHFEQFDCRVVYIRENNLSAVFFGDVDYSQED